MVNANNIAVPGPLDVTTLPLTTTLSSPYSHPFPSISSLTLGWLVTRTPSRGFSNAATSVIVAAQIKAMYAPAERYCRMRSRTAGEEQNVFEPGSPPGRTRMLGVGSVAAVLIVMSGVMRTLREQVAYCPLLRSTPTLLTSTPARTSTS